jgi:uncharacterized membrane protein YbaN (DUF454 family)
VWALAIVVLSVGVLAWRTEMGWLPAVILAVLAIGACVAIVWRMTEE